MAIKSDSELETIVREVILQLDKHIFDRVQDAKLESSRRMLIGVRDALIRKDELTPRQIQGLNDASSALRELVSDERISNQLWDMTDYLEIRAKRPQGT